MKNFKVILPIIILIVYFFYIASTGLNHDLRNTDEGIYMNVASESVKNNTWLRTTYFGSPYYNKLPFSIWSYKIALMMFDYKDVGYRGVQLFIGVLVLLSIFFICQKLINNITISFLSVFFILTLPRFFKFLTEIKMDTLLLFFQVLSLLFLYCWYERYSEKKDSRNFLYAFLFTITLCLSFFTKTVMSVLVPISFFVFLVFVKELRFVLNQKKEILFSVSLFFIILACVFFIFFPKEIRQILYNTLFLTEIKKRALEGMHNQEENFYYIKQVLSGQSLFPLYLLFSSTIYMIYLAIKEKRKEILFLFSWGITPIFVMSLAKSRLLWYIILSFPAFAIMVSIFTYDTFSKLFSSIKARKINLLCLLLCVFTTLTIYNQIVRITNLFYVSNYTDPLKKFVYEIKKPENKDKKVCIYDDRKKLLSNEKLRASLSERMLKKLLSKKKGEFEKFYLTQIKDNVVTLDDDNVEKEVLEKKCDYYILPFEGLFSRDVVKNNISSFTLLTTNNTTKKSKVIFSFNKEDKILPIMNDQGSDISDAFEVYVDDKSAKLPYLIKDQEKLEIKGLNEKETSCILSINLRNNKIKPKSYISINQTKIKVIFPQNRLYFLKKIKKGENLSISTYFDDKNRMLVDFYCGEKINKKEYLDRFLNTQKFTKISLSTRKFNIKTLHFRILGSIII